MHMARSEQKALPLLIKSGRVKRRVQKHPAGYMPQALQRGQKPVRSFQVYSSQTDDWRLVREFEDTSVDVA